MRNKIFNEIFDLMIQPGDRIEPIYNWLIQNVWSEKNFGSKAQTKYLEDGEKQVLKLEELAIHTAPGVYDELVSLAQRDFSILSELSKDKTAVIIFDGMSLREIPLIKKLAEQTGFVVQESSYKFAAVPSDTVSYVEQRVIGKQIAPSQLESRKELKERNIKTYYYDTPIRHFELPSNGESYFLWSSFPDGTYSNFEARNSLHFETLVKQFDVVWKNIVLAIPKDYRIIITSDHGYIYLKAGFESGNKGEAALKFLNQERYRFFDEEITSHIPELQVIPQRKLATIKGRIKNRPKGPSSNKVFRHGGLSIMEMLTPWIVIERK